MTVDVSTSNFSFANQEVIYEVTAATNNKIESEQPLTVNVKFTTEPPQFDLTSFDSSSSTLKCNLEDASWEFKLPPLVNDEMQNSLISMETDSSFFEFDQKSLTVHLKSEKRS